MGVEGMASHPDGRGVSRSYLFFQKLYNEPLAPLGCAATVTALVMGLTTLKTGDKVKAQRMMRYRVFAQLGTVIAFAYYYYRPNQNRPNSQGQVLSHKQHQVLSQEGHSASGHKHS